MTGHPHQIVPSPQTTLIPHLSPDQIAQLAYPPDILPGHRDVNTPYGSMRVYEWGPEAGRKVLFVHGDATPSPMFRPIAGDFVAYGCRVMLFDLWGRGYSDTPASSPHTVSLYAEQITYARTSSPISWDVSAPFSLIGFSMGGCITLEYFSQHAGMINDIILLGPAGLIRTLPTAYTNPLFRSPSPLPPLELRRLIGDLLGVDTTDPSLKTPSQIPPTQIPFSPASAPQFQFDYHAGHVESFLSTILHGPLQHQTSIWKAAGAMLQDAQKARRLLCICGADDPVVPARDVERDLRKYMGDGKLGHWRFDTVPGGHGFPWSAGREVAARILEFWGLRSSRG